MPCPTTPHSATQKMHHRSRRTDDPKNTFAQNSKASRNNQFIGTAAQSITCLNGCSRAVKRRVPSPALPKQSEAGSCPAPTTSRTTTPGESGDTSQYWQQQKVRELQSPWFQCLSEPSNLSSRSSSGATQALTCTSSKSVPMQGTRGSKSGNNHTGNCIRAWLRCL